MHGPNRATDPAIAHRKCHSAQSGNRRKPRLHHDSYKRNHSYLQQPQAKKKQQTDPRAGLEQPQSTIQVVDQKAH